MSEYVCMYVLQNTNELWNTTKFVHQLQCKHQLCVCVWGGGGMISPVTTPSMNLSRWTVDNGYKHIASA